MAREIPPGASGLLSYFTRHRTLANLLLVVMLVAGIGAVPNLRTQFFPDVIVDNVAFGSVAAEAGFDWDQKIEQVEVPADQPSKYLMFIPALILLGLVVMLQRGRARPQPATA